MRGLRAAWICAALALGAIVAPPDAAAATAAEIEGLGEEVRRRVKDNSGYELHWEIKRIGRPPQD